MTNYYGQPKHYRFQDEHEAFRALIAVLNRQGGVYFLIGGQARDLFLYKMKLQPPAVTRDIDFAVLVEDLADWNSLLSELMDAGFQKTSLPFRMHWPLTNTKIDLLPFGGIAPKDSMKFPGEEEGMSVVGMREVSDQLEVMHLGEDGSLSIPVAPLSGIFLLKLISWSDRPELRQKDLSDMCLIAWHYYDHVFERILEFDYDIFNLASTNAEYGARMLGRDIGGIICSSPQLFSRVHGLLKGSIEHIDSPTPLAMGFIRWHFDEPDTLEDAQALLRQIVQGIDDRCHGVGSRTPN